MHPYQLLHLSSTVTLQCRQYVEHIGYQMKVHTHQLFYLSSTVTLQGRQYVEVGCVYSVQWWLVLCESNAKPAFLCPSAHSFP
jgi:hypothetical protein